MSFHSVLIGTGGSDADFLGDIRAALSMGTTGTNAGRGFLPTSRTPKEVWLERLDVEQISTGAFNKLHNHKYRIHVRIRTGVTGSDQTNENQLTTLDADLETLVQRYRGVKTVAAIGGNGGIAFDTVFDGTSYTVVTISVTEAQIDPEPDDQMNMLGYVEIDFLVNHET
jgi:hypothetical protein